MKQRDWITLALFVGAAYVIFRVKVPGSGSALTIASGPATVGFIDETQQVQYDPATGNLWDVSGSTNTLIATIAAGGDATIFAQPSVQALITAAIAARPG